MKSTYNDYSWSFLVASPSFYGPFFEESVVLLLEDNEDGSFGIVVNKPLGKTLGELSNAFNNELSEIEVFEGGPVSPDHISLAICCDDGKSDGAFSFGIAPEKAIEIMKKDPNAKVAAFAGYTGWGPNQLQTEINDGTWIISEADMDAVINLPPPAVWEYILTKEKPELKELHPPVNSPELN